MSESAHGRVRALPLRQSVDPRAIDAGWEHIRARREGRARSATARRVMFAVPALALAALLVFVLKAFVFTASTSPQPIALATGAPLPDEWSAPTAKVIALDDGSRLEIDAATKLHPTNRATRKSDPARVELTLESGGTTFDVKPGGPRVWVIDAGGVVVRVLGTRFRVERTASSVDVKVERGKVSVEGAGVEGGAKLLVAGDSIHVVEPASKPHAFTTPRSAPPLSSIPTPHSAPPLSSIPTPHSAPPLSSIPSPTTLPAPIAPVVEPTPTVALPPAIARNHISTSRPPIPSAPTAAAARATVDVPKADVPKADAPQGDAAKVDAPKADAPKAAPVDPMATADGARRAGRPREAVAILTVLVEKKDARAPLAAFTLGKIHAEDLVDHATAAIWFERAIASGLPRGLDEEAHARAVESHAKAGRRVDAARAAQRYEAAFPNGRHLERVRGFVRN